MCGSGPESDTSRGRFPGRAKRWFGAAVNQLDAFINQVEAQRGKKISDEDADALIAAAGAIIALVSE